MQEKQHPIASGSPSWRSPALAGRLRWWRWRGPNDECRCRGAERVGHCLFTRAVALALALRPPPRDRWEHRGTGKNGPRRRGAAAHGIRTHRAAGCAATPGHRAGHRWT